MKKLLSFFIFIFSLLIIFVNKISCDDDATSKTFFSIRTPFRPSSPEIVTIRRNELSFYENEYKFSFDVIPYGGASLNEAGLAKYFLPFSKTEIIAGELGSNAVKQDAVDVIANYFGILTSNMYEPGTPVGNTLDNYTFESKVKFEPKHKFYGVTFAFKQHLSRFTDRGFWYEIVLPIEHITNDVGLKETVIKKGGPNGNNPKVPQGFVGNMTEAFKQQSWRYGKINGPQSVTGVADLYIKFGYLSIKEETHHLNSYVGLSAPTGTRITNEFVFEPIVGQNEHATIFAGSTAGFRILSACEKSIYFEFDTCGILYLENNQLRSFDLKDKAWSRYMWVYLDKTSTTTSPGINAFTKLMTVNPGSSRDLNSAFVYKDRCNGFQAEVGYHFFARQAEDVRLAQPWQQGPAIASIIKNNEFIAGGTSRNNATINQYLGIENDTINGEQVYQDIKESDINLESASHPGFISHTVYLTLQKNWENCEYPKFLGAGGSYEWAVNNAVMERWMLWFRFGISF